MDQSEKDAFLEEAKRRYPKGTRYIPAHVRTGIKEVTGDDYRINGDFIHVDSDDIEGNYVECIYDKGRWAEIVSKPEVKEEPVIKSQFIVGKWYKRTDSNLKAGFVTWIKCSSAIPFKDSEHILFEGTHVIGERKGRSTYNWKLLTDLSEIQQYLPEGHPDKFPVKKDPMKELSTLPEKWCIQVTKSSVKAVSDFFHSKGHLYIGYNSSWKVSDDLTQYYHFPQTRPLVWGEREIKSGYTEITFDQFKKWVLKEPEELKMSDLVRGEIYYGGFSNRLKEDGWIFKYKADELHVGTKHFHKGPHSHGLDWARYATSEEKQWLQACIKAGKFVSLEDSKKPDVPEYVECIKNPEWADVNVGSIWKTDTAGYPKGTYRIVWPNGSGQTTQGKEHCFKLSTKEAYDAQRNPKPIPRPEPVKMHQTPAEKLGYKIGDTFQIIAPDPHCSLPIGEVVILKADDRTQSPLFDHVTLGSQYIKLSCVIPYVEVFKEEWVPKTGDWVVITQSGFTSLGCVQLTDRHQKMEYFNTSVGTPFSYSKDQFRKALPHEIPSTAKAYSVVPDPPTREPQKKLTPFEQRGWDATTLFRVLDGIWKDRTVRLTRDDRSVAPLMKCEVTGETSYLNLERLQPVSLDRPETEDSSEDLFHFSDEALLEYCRKKFPIGCSMVNHLSLDTMTIVDHDPFYKSDLFGRNRGDRQVWFSAGDRVALVYDERAGHKQKLARIVSYGFSRPTANSYHSTGNVGKPSHGSSEDMFKPSKTI